MLYTLVAHIDASDAESGCLMTSFVEIVGTIFNAFKGPKPN